LLSMYLQTATKDTRTVWLGETAVKPNLRMHLQQSGAGVCASEAASQAQASWDMAHRQYAAKHSAAQRRDTPDLPCQPRMDEAVGCDEVVGQRGLAMVDMCQHTHIADAGLQVDSVCVRRV
jgi:hypothetical protein